MLGGTISGNSSLLDSSLGRSLDFGGLIEDGVLARQLGDGGGRGGAVSGNSSSLVGSLSRSLAAKGAAKGAAAESARSWASRRALSPASCAGSLDSPRSCSAEDTP